jgi:hypothetical protein
MKTYEGVQLFLTSALDGEEFSALRAGHFVSGERAPSTNWLGAWVGPRTNLDAVGKREVSFHCRKSNSGRPAHSPSLFQLNYPGSFMYVIPFKIDLLKTENSSK